MTKTGRPTKKASDRRNVLIQLLVTKEEKRHLETNLTTWNAAHPDSPPWSLRDFLVYAPTLLLHLEGQNRKMALDIERSISNSEETHKRFNEVFTLAESASKDAKQYGDLLVETHRVLELIDSPEAKLLHRLISARLNEILERKFPGLLTRKTSSQAHDEDKSNER